MGFLKETRMKNGDFVGVKWRGKWWEVEHYEQFSLGNEQVFEGLKLKSNED